MQSTLVLLDQKERWSNTITTLTYDLQSSLYLCGSGVTRRARPDLTCRCSQNIQQDLDPDQERFQQRKKARLEAAQAKPPGSSPLKRLATNAANLLFPVQQLSHHLSLVRVFLFVTKLGASCLRVSSLNSQFPPSSCPSLTCRESNTDKLHGNSEFDNEAEVLIKDMEFGLVARFGGSSQPKAQEEAPMKPEDAENAPEEIGDEDEEDLELKLAILDMYNERINKRIEIKSLIFDRNLVDYRKVCFITGSTWLETEPRAEPSHRQKTEQRRKRCNSAQQAIRSTAKSSRPRSIHRRITMCVCSSFRLTYLMPIIDR